MVLPPADEGPGCEWEELSCVELGRGWPRPWAARLEELEAEPWSTMVSSEGVNLVVLVALLWMTFLSSSSPSSSELECPG